MILATAARRAGSQTSADRLAAFIEDAVSTLEVAIYDFRLANTELAATVVGALTGAARRGVTVRLAYDAGKPTMGTAVMFARLAVDPEIGRAHV